MGSPILNNHSFLYPPIFSLLELFLSNYNQNYCLLNYFVGGGIEIDHFEQTDPDKLPITMRKTIV